MCFFSMGRVSQRVMAFAAAALLQACGSVQYTVDDGSKVNEALLSSIRLYGQGERTLRPAIQRSGALKDANCSTQWDIPFSVATSYAVDEKADRVAWARALQVDERLSVVSATLDSGGVVVGDKIVELDGYRSDNTKKMIERLDELREDGDPFPVVTAAGKTLTITPFKVCRGYVRIAPPTQPYFQDFHWLKSSHPLEVFNPAITPDEALWMVLWTQGLSEEGGAKMKTFHYSKETLLTAIDIASFAFAANGVVQAGKAAANQAISSASAAATRAASDAVARRALESAGKKAAEAMVKEYAQQIVEEVGKETAKQMSLVAAESFAVRVGFSVNMLSRVASTDFDDADAWAFQRMSLLNADPSAGATLHRKLFEQGMTHNAFVFDEDRMTSLIGVARNVRHDEMLAAAFRGVARDAGLQTADMPDASGQDVATEDNSMGMTATVAPESMEMPSAMEK